MIGSRGAATAADDEGSTVILTIGYAMLALATILVCVDATSLYLAQRRLDAVADAAALAAADAFALTVEAGVPVARLDDEQVWEHAEALVHAADGPAVLVRAEAPDGLSARVTVTGTWRPPVLTVFVPQGVELEATATSRTALR